MSDTKISDPLEQKSDAVGADTAYLIYKIREKKDRRSGIDRRRFSYVGYLPERRSGEERRDIPGRRETDRKKTRPS